MFEERWHPLRKEWVVISSNRGSRPWQGDSVPVDLERKASYVADCYLCPDNLRASGVRNPQYRGIYAFRNDFPCVVSNAPAAQPSAEPLFLNQRSEGVARVVCYSPRHDLTLAELSQAEIVALLHELGRQYAELAALPDVNHVLMFENKGAVVGTSNPHPHCQIYATNFVFRTIEVEDEATSEYFLKHRRTLLCDLMAAEERYQWRILSSNERALGWIPYFARYAYEIYVAPRAPRASIADLTAEELHDFAAALRDAVVRLDNLWAMSFPYVLALHQAPTDGRPHPGFHFHVEIHPPLRQPGLLKYLAGPEIGGGNFLNDADPDRSAAELRALTDIHYTQFT